MTQNSQWTQQPMMTHEQYTSVVLRQIVRHAPHLMSQAMDTSPAGLYALVRRLAEHDLLLLRLMIPTPYQQDPHRVTAEWVQQVVALYQHFAGSFFPTHAEVDAHYVDKIPTGDEVVVRLRGRATDVLLALADFALPYVISRQALTTPLPPHETRLILHEMLYDLASTNLEPPVYDQFIRTGSALLNQLKTPTVSPIATTRLAREVVPPLPPAALRPTTLPSVKRPDPPPPAAPPAAPPSAPELPILEDDPPTGDSTALIRHMLPGRGKDKSGRQPPLPPVPRPGKKRDEDDRAP